jgi:hypothetical protein
MKIVSNFEEQNILRKPLDSILDTEEYVRRMLSKGVSLTPYQKYAAQFGTDALFYLPLDEVSGSVATDLTGNAIHGAYAAAVALANTTSPTGRPCPYFDGANGTRINVYSSALNTLFGRTEGTLRILVKVTATEWADGAARYGLSIMDGSARKVDCGVKSSTNSTIGYDYTTVTRTSGSQSDIGWVYHAITWTKTGNEIRAYKNGIQVGTTAAYSGATEMNGALFVNGCNIGHKRSDTEQSPWKGWLADAMGLKRAATVAEIAQDYVNCTNP